MDTEMTLPVLIITFFATLALGLVAYRMVRSRRFPESNEPTDQTRRADEALQES